MQVISTKIGVQQFVLRIKQYGFTHVVISPGSRNAPLTISFTADNYFTCFSIPDERSAAFYALGMAEMLKKPVLLLCTSGSAILNYYPAVSEAFYRSIPLLVVSADRPKQWIDQGDGQTIRQEGVLRNHVVDETELSEHFVHPNEAKENIQRIDRVISAALFKNGGGPVHFNFPLEEPLYDVVQLAENTESLSLYDLPDFVTRDTFSAFDTLVQEWNTYPKKMIICGQMEPNSVFWNKLNELSNDNSVAVLVENTSNGYGRKFNHCIDRTLNSISPELEADFAPDLLITFGGAVISKRIKAFLRKNKPKAHWKIGKAFPTMNTYGALNQSIELTPSDFLQHFLQLPLQFHSSRFGEQWKQLDYLIQDKHHMVCSALPFSDMAVFHLIMDTIPDAAVLHMANSSVVRYCQLFDPIPTITYYSNRGTSGIDGSTSTAIGAAIIQKEKLHVLITGDISFFYDSNALWNKYIPSNFRMILINNGGGGIFRIIPGPASSEALDDYFVANHDYSAEFICKAFGIEYMVANDLVAMEAQLSAFYYPEVDKPIVLEIKTPRTLNDKELKSYFDKIRVKSFPKLC